MRSDHGRDQWLSPLSFIFLFWMSKVFFMLSMASNNGYHHWALHIFFWNVQGVYMLSMALNRGYHHWALHIFFLECPRFFLCYPWHRTVAITTKLYIIFLGECPRVFYSIHGIEQWLSPLSFTLFFLECQRVIHDIHGIEQWLSPLSFAYIIFWMSKGFICYPWHWTGAITTELYIIFFLMSKGYSWYPWYRTVVITTKRYHVV